MCLLVVEGRGSQNITCALHWSCGREHQTNQTVLPTLQPRKEKKRKEKKRKEKTRLDYAFRRQFIEKPSTIPGCPRFTTYTKQVLSNVLVQPFCVFLSVSNVAKRTNPELLFTTQLAETDQTLEYTWHA